MLTLRFLGGFEVLVDGSPARCTPAPGRLLCRLALDANRPVARNRLWQDLWPDSDTPDVVDINLRRLRKDVLGAEADRLSIENATITLNLEGAEVDFLRFRALAQDGSNTGLEACVQLYRGELLWRYLDEDWASDLRDELKTEFEDALKTLAEQAQQEGNFLAATRYLRRFIASNPDYEWGWRRLIETYAQWGNPSEALVTYSHYVEYIRQNRTPSSARVEELVRRLGLLESPPSLRRAPSCEERPAPDRPPIIGGALPPDTPFYVARYEDTQAAQALVAPGVTVRIKGPRLVGKSSLLARTLQRCREAGMKVLLTDWQNLPHQALGSAEAFYLTLAYRLADQAGLDGDPTSVFQPHLAPGDNFDRFLTRFLTPAVEGPIVWAIDEADRIFSSDFFGDVFAKLRSWHNARALDAQGPFTRLSLALSYSTEARLFIPNLNQSPFNVGIEIALQDFSAEETANLHTIYGRPLASQQALDRLYRLVGGHPYLLSRAFYEARVQGKTIEQIEAQAEQSAGIFSDHLERIRFVLSLNPELRDAVRALLLEGKPPALEQSVRLNAAGILATNRAGKAQPRCLLYQRYLRQALA
jgi:DNA-binding SARP family transcriptional activator